MFIYLFSLFGCQPDKTAEPPACGISETAFVKSRIVQGDVLWLPTPVGDCESGRWLLSEGASVNAIHHGDQWSSMTMDGLGLHRFEHNGVQVEASVVAADDAPFHNLAYYPGNTIAKVGDDWWVAQAYSPELSVISNGETIAEVAVGPWPVALAVTPDEETVLVATRANDSIGIVSVAAQRIVDSIYVGDEPVHVAVHPAGELAFVSLNTTAEIAVLDLNLNTVVALWPSVRDAAAFALNADGSQLVVLSHRSGRPERTPYDSDDQGDEMDAVLMDTATGEIVQAYFDIGGTNNSVVFAEDGASFYMTTILGDNAKKLTSGTAFEHRVRRIDVNTGEILADADLSRQDSSQGVAVTPHQLTLHNGALWLVAEGSEQLLQLNPATLEEVSRTEAPGLPRAVLATDSGLAVHGLNDYDLHLYDGNGVWAESISLGVDPRTPELALGHELFFKPGVNYAVNYACNSCHADTRGDTRVWQAGPLEVNEVSRSLFWLEGTDPLGWSGYVNSVRNFGFAGSASIGVRLTTDESIAMQDFLASLMPPPAANHRTHYDGSLSEAGQRGKELFNGKAACASCHGGLVATNNLTAADGVTPNQTSTPSLVGVYRHGVWLKHGEATTYGDSVEQVLDWMGNDSLTQTEKDDLLHYLESMTDRHFFVLDDGFGGRPDIVGVDADLTLTMNQPVWSDSVVVELAAADGALIAVDVVVEKRRIVVRPLATLTYAADYTLKLKDARSFAGRKLGGINEWAFSTAKEPELALNGTYTWSVDIPAFNPVEQTFDESTLLPFPHRLTAVPTESGALLTIDYGEDMRYDVAVIIDGKDLYTPSLPVSFGNSAADSAGMTSTLLDTDSDGIADVALGTTLVSGPGIWLEDLFWQLETAIPLDACEPGLEGDFDIVVAVDGSEVEVDWEGGALGFFVTTYSASLPVGPGQTVSNGTAYWAVQTDSFPNGFAGPVVYGVLPEGAREDSLANNAPEGGAPLEPGMCLKFSVIRDDFTISSKTLILE